MERTVRPNDVSVRRTWVCALPWGISAVLAVILSFLVDETLAAWIAQPMSSGQLKATLASFRCWGEAPTIVIVCVGLYLGTRHDWRVPVGILVGTLVVGIMVSTVKPVFGRARPEESVSRDLSGAWNGTSEHNSSMPSGHVATAFAFARGLSVAYPALQPVCLVAAGGTAMSRMRDQRHYLSDCVVGGILGWVVAGAVTSRILASGSHRGWKIIRWNQWSVRRAG